MKEISLLGILVLRSVDDMVVIRPGLLTETMVGTELRSQAGQFRGQIYKIKKMIIKVDEGSFRMGHSHCRNTVL